MLGSIALNGIIVRFMLVQMRFNQAYVAER